MTALERAWFENKKWIWLLVPLALLFWLVSTIRRLAYQYRLLRSEKPDIPVIIVGNISVGGNGKTPLVIALCERLKAEGFRPGVISRGYAGNADSFPHAISPGDLPSKVGDEPFLIYQRLHIPIVIDPVRKRGAQYLFEKLNCNIIVCDDGLQHYALQRDIEIAVIDGQRRNGNGFLLPMGPLRETEARLQSVDFVVVNGGKTNANEIPMSLLFDKLINVRNPEITLSLEDLSTPVVAVAGIGNPQRFFNVLTERGIRLEKALALPDHHAFTTSDIPQTDKPVLMTEKDAVKCKTFAQDNWWYLPVNGQLPETFFAQILNKINQKN